MRRRARSDWPIVLASWALLASGLALLSAGMLYTDAVTLAGLHRQLEEAPAPDRAVLVRTKLLADRLAAADAAVRPELDRIVVPTGGDVVRVLRSSPYAEPGADASSVTNLTLFAAYQGIEEHAELVAGAWPVPGSTPVQATLSEPAAALLGLTAGDTLAVASRVDPARSVDVAITGVWRADPADPWWLDEPLALTGTEQGGSFTTTGPLVVAPEELVGGPLSEPLDTQWRAIPRVAGFTPRNVEEVSALAADAEPRINAALPASNRAQVLTKLPAILASVDRSVLVTQAGILLLLVQFGVLAAYAVILVAALLLERRRTETALLRARGAGFRHLLAMSLGEALLVTIPAVLVAPALATLLVQAVRLNPALQGIGLETPLPGPSTIAVALIGGAFALVALTVPTVASNVNIAGVRAAVGRQVGRTLPQRLGLDLLLVALAALAFVQLRLYGAPITRNARGALGVDPLLVAAPAIGLIAGAVIAVRLVPRLAELGERALSRGRALVPSMAGRQVARRPLRYTRAALLLILASALGTFASAHAATWTRSQDDQAAYAAGADVRVFPAARSAVPGWALGGALRGVEGVTAATPVVEASIQLGTTLRDGEVRGIDGTSMAEIVRVRDDGAGAVTLDALRALGAARPDAPGIPLPEGTRRLSVVADARVTTAEGFERRDPSADGLSAAVDVLDGDGRLVRLGAEIDELNTNRARVVIPLDAAAGGSLTLPATVVAFHVAVGVGGPGNVAVEGLLTVRSLEASAAAEGDAWTALPVSGGTTVISSTSIGTEERDDPGPLPERVAFEALFAGERLEYVRSLAPPAPPVAPVVVNGAFLERTSAAVGDTLGASVFGVPLDVRILAVVDGFPTLDADRPFALMDGLALDLARLDARVAAAGTDEWWLAVADEAGGSVTTAITAEPVAAEQVVGRDAVQADLAGDPLGLGVIGILGLGSLAALVFAAIGFLVSVTVSTNERLGELALLKALGLAPRQLLRWLSVESIVLLAVGLVAGIGLGLVLAWLALPFATLTASGEPPVPAPDVVVPLEALVPTLVLGILLSIATVLLVRRQLPAARTSAVLRARDE
ncbi:MAG TPA: ABC transporter permease [Candidatus Limnocylindrales bacterium]|nr:ABC transporter permease [Candidatus Limnocylindrales bacterium]